MAAAEAMIAGPLEGAEVMAAELFSLSRILLRSQGVLPVTVKLVLPLLPLEEQVEVDQADRF